jgi:hypothetical protein
MKKQERPGPSSPPPAAGLTADQEQAIPFLLAGKSPTDTAAEIGVPGEDLHRWLTTDAAFVAALNRRREEDWEAHWERRRHLVGKAVDTLAALLDSADETTRLKAAGAVLRFASTNVRTPFGPTDPVAVALQWEKEATHRRSQGEIAHLLHLL